MPEGPSILALRDKLLPFKGKTVRKAGGYGKMPTGWLENRKLLDIKCWGKHLLFVFTNGIVRVHLGLFGSVLVDKRKKVNRSFFLEFANGEINGYVVKAKKLEDDLDETYDWRVDILSPRFDPKHVKTLLKKVPEKEIDEVLMDQDIFSGVGNIIRNESLYLAGIHPLSKVGNIPAAKMNALIKAVVKYGTEFYQSLKQQGRHAKFSVYHQKFAADGSEVTMKILPKSKRKIYFSEHRQKLYN